MHVHIYTIQYCYILFFIRNLSIFFERVPDTGDIKYPTSDVRSPAKYPILKMSNIIVVSQAGRILIWKCLVSPTARFNFDDFDWRPVKSSLKKPSLQVCPSNNLFYDNTCADTDGEF